ncbi:hypothetical protein [Chryseobacterium daecheongense]|uniref:Quinol oxidase subunit 4 n=1 Tax=Chryseobacterium daecheongense TaxID=192389 RepID=A0ABY2FYZ7_9FLAO|nr:hypothetical protein [Chryseobacterium daecheongense]TDX94559.1 hypothetical protein BCF50_0327 [Chryseobacterium daecheongense]UOU96780.1 hypothetical protein MUU74_09765 [Chryseobacterium daecheongense]
MKEMLKRIGWVALILIIITAISGFLYTQKYQSEKSLMGKIQHQSLKKMVPKKAIKSH